MPAHCSNCQSRLRATLIDSRAYRFGVCDICFIDLFTQCSDCHCWLKRDDAIRNGYRYYCPSCASVNSQRCYCCGRPDVTRWQYYNQHSYCSTCFDRLFTACGACGHTTERDCYIHPDSGVTLCDDCFNDEFACCYDCGEAFSRDDLIPYNGHHWCDRCDPRGENEWPIGEFICESPCFTEIKSSRQFGVEIETSRCHGHRRLFDKISWGCTSDYSIDGKEFVSPILYGDAGLEDVVNICNIASEKLWKTNDSCGLHIHLDIKNETWQSLQRIAYAYYKTYSAWIQLVPTTRRLNAMCGPPHYGHDDITSIQNFEDWEYFTGHRDRFEWINWRAFLVHGSLEIRFHQGTLDADAICNWIRAHTRFVDFVATLTLNEIDELFSSDIFENLMDIIGSDISMYYTEVASKFSGAVETVFG